MRSEDMSYGPITWTVNATATNATATATKAAGGVGKTHAILGIIFSISGGAIAAAVQGQIKSGANVLVNFELPAASPGVTPTYFEFARPILCNDNEDAVLTIPALGAAIKCTVCILGSTWGSR